MNKYYVYQNLTQFQVEIKAKSEKEAIEKAKKLPIEYWNEYEPVEENIFYDAICVEK
jgi:hypothetical protein